VGKCPLALHQEKKGHLWGIHVDVWQNQYNTVKKKILIKKKRRKEISFCFEAYSESALMPWNILFLKSTRIH